MKFILALFLSLISTLAYADSQRNPCFYNVNGGCQSVDTNNPLPITSTNFYTYSTGVHAYAGYANATDFFSIKGSNTKIIKIISIRLSGVATGNNNIDVALLKRSTLNTGGTPTVATLTPLDSANPSATATIVTYGSAPTLGTLVGPLCACQVELPAPTNIGGYILEWQFNRNGGSPIVLRGSNEMATLNSYGTSFPAGTLLNITTTWTEQ